MLTIRNEVVMSQNFQNTLASLCRQPLPVKTAFNLKVMLNRLDKVVKDSNEVKKEIFREFCELDEKGEVKAKTQVIKSKDGQEQEVPVPGSFTLREGVEKEFEEKISAWKKHEHEFKGNKLDLDAFGDIKISAAELNMIEDLIDLGEGKPDLKLV